MGLGNSKRARRSLRSSLEVMANPKESDSKRIHASECLTKFDAVPQHVVDNPECLESILRVVESERCPVRVLHNIGQVMVSLAEDEAHVEVLSTRAGLQCMAKLVGSDDPSVCTLGLTAIRETSLQTPLCDALIEAGMVDLLLDCAQQRARQRELAVSIFRNLTYTGPLTRRITRSGRFPDLVAFAGVDMQPMVRVEALRVLLNISSHDETLATVVGEPTTIDIIMQGLLSAPDPGEGSCRADVLRLAADVLQNVARSRDGTQAVFEHRVADALLPAVSSRLVDSRDVSVCTTALHALQNLASDIQEEHVLPFLETDVMKCVYSFLGKSDTAEMRQRASSAYYIVMNFIISGGGEPVRKKLVKMGVTEGLCHLLKHARDEGVRNNVLITLSDMCMDDDAAKEVVWEQGMLDVYVPLLVAEDEETKWRVLYALCPMALRGRNCRRMVELGIMEPLISLVPSEHETVVLYAASLAQFLSNQGDSLLPLIEAGGIEFFYRLRELNMQDTLEPIIRYSFENMQVHGELADLDLDRVTERAREWQRGAEAMEEKDFVRTQRHLERVMVLYPDEVYPLLTIAYCKWMVEDFDGCEEYIRLAMSKGYNEWPHFIRNVEDSERWDGYDLSEFKELIRGLTETNKAEDAQTEQPHSIVAHRSSADLLSSMVESASGVAGGTTHHHSMASSPLERATSASNVNTSSDAGAGASSSSSSSSSAPPLPAVNDTMSDPTTASDRVAVRTTSTTGSAASAHLPRIDLDRVLAKLRSSAYALDKWKVLTDLSEAHSGLTCADAYTLAGTFLMSSERMRVIEHLYPLLTDPENCMDDLIAKALSYSRDREVMCATLGLASPTTL